MRLARGLQQSARIGDHPISLGVNDRDTGQEISFTKTSAFPVSSPAMIKVDGSLVGHRR